MIELLQQRLSRYTIDGAEQQEQALVWELTLYALWRKVLSGCRVSGGTCLHSLWIAAVSEI